MMNRASSWRRGAVCAAIWLLWIGPLHAAGGLSVSPVRVELDSARPVATLRVINRDQRVSRVQTEVLAWQQRGGEAIYSPATDLLVTPPIFEVAAHSEQIVRLGFLSVPAERLLEKAYRVFFREIPRPGDEASGVQLLLRIGIPVFLRPTPINRRLERIKPVTESAASVTLHNPGNVHVRLDAVEWRVDGQTLSREAQLRYLFPGEQHGWTPTAHAERADELRITTERGVEGFRLVPPGP